MASRTESLPRYENDTLLTPPEVLQYGKSPLELAHGLDKLDRVVIVLFDAGADREDIDVEDDVFRRKAGLLCK